MAKNIRGALRREQNVTNHFDRYESAIEYARAYNGNFEFMVSIHEKSLEPGWWPTPNQVRAILKCKKYATTTKESHPAGGRRARFVATGHI